MKKLVINLESRPDRKAEMQRELARVGWEAEFIKAERPSSANQFPSIGARGCFLSHLKALRSSLDEDLVLMEDDLNLSTDFVKRWPVEFGALPEDWDIFYPAHDAGVGLIPPSRGIMCTHMVVFRSRIIPRLISELETFLARPAGHPQGGPMHVDGAYSTVRKQNPGIMTYACSPPLGYQRSSKSDIAPGSAIKDALRPVATRLRALWR